MNLVHEIKNCTICKHHLNHKPRPVVSFSSNSKIAIIGQAPGSKVHASGIPWDDASGNKLREWLGVNKAEFYDTSNFAIVPMGFCYPGKGKSGDLPPRPECAPKWHSDIFQELNSVELILLIGKYSQGYYLKERSMQNLTATVQNFKAYLPKYFVLPHPSPRNNIWMAKNPWFQQKALPEFKLVVESILKNE